MLVNGNDLFTVFHKNPYQKWYDNIIYDVTINVISVFTK